MLNYFILKDIIFQIIIFDFYKLANPFIAFISQLFLFHFIIKSYILNLNL